MTNRRMALLAAGVLLAACNSSRFPTDPEADTFPPLEIDGAAVLGGVALVDGAFAWTVVAPPVIGPETYRMAVVAENDVWFVGNGIRHWNGTTLDELLPPRPPGEYFDSGKKLVPFVLYDIAMLAPNDIWVCGSRMFHWDGAAWTDRTPADSTTGIRFTCSVAASAGRLFASIDGKQRVREPDGAWHDLASAYYEQGTGTYIGEMGGTVGWGHCLELGPAGELVIIGRGVLTEVHDPSPSPQSPFPPDRVDVTPGLRNLLRCDDIVRVGSTFHSARFQGDDGGDGLTFVSATLPGDFQAVATLNGLDGFAGANNNESPIVGLAVRAAGSLALVRGRDEKNRRLSFLVESTGSTARLLPDRLYGWEGAAIGFDDETVLVAAQGGSILKGVRR